VLDILQSALPLSLANRLTMVLSGAVIPGATILAAVTLSPFSAGTSHLALAAISFVATAGLIALAPVISRQYGRTLVEFLQRRGARKLPSVSLPALELDPAILEGLIGLLGSFDPEKVELAARLLERTGEKRVVHLMREALVVTRSGKVAHALLGQKEVVRNVSIAGILVGRMQEVEIPRDSAGSEIPLAVLTEHLAVRGVAFRPVLEMLSRHADPRVAVEAVRFLLRIGEGKDRLPWLRELLRSTSRADRLVAARGLAACGDESLMHDLMHLLEERATTSAAFAALEELDRRPDAARLGTYVKNLPRGDVPARRQAFRLIARGPSPEAIPLVVGLLCRREPMIVREAVAYLNKHWEESLPWLDRAMAEAGTTVGARVEILSAWVRWRQRERMEAAMIELRARAGRLVRWRESLPPRPAPAEADLAPGFLRAVLGQRLEELKRLIARGYLEAAGGSDHQHVVGGLASPDPGVRSRALEALREVLPPGEAGGVMPFFEIAQDAMLLQHLRDHGHVSGGALPSAALLDELGASGDHFLSSGARYLLECAAPVPVEGAIA
jgi:HEAT repeat protein